MHQQAVLRYWLIRRGFKDIVEKQNVLTATDGIATCYVGVLNTLSVREMRDLVCQKKHYDEVWAALPPASNVNVSQARRLKAELLAGEGIGVLEFSSLGAVAVPVQRGRFAWGNVAG